MALALGGARLEVGMLPGATRCVSAKEKIVDFLIVLLATVVGCLVFRAPLKKAPVLFYVLAIALDVFFAAGLSLGLPRELWSVLMLLMQKCTLSLAIFVVVMYIGVFRVDSQVGRWLRPVRSELSIIACILAAGHMAVYLAAFAPRLSAGHAVNSNVALSFGVAVALLALLLVLGVTSFSFVKRRMRADSWKRLQRFAYLFFGLVYVHLMVMLAPAALQGGAASRESIVVYSVVFIGYGVARVARALADRTIDADPAARVATVEEFDLQQA